MRWEGGRPGGDLQCFLSRMNKACVYVCVCVVEAFSHWLQCPIYINRESKQEMGTYRNAFLHQSVTRSLDEMTGGMETCGLSQVESSDIFAD